MNKEYLKQVREGRYNGGVDSIFEVRGGQSLNLPMGKRICFGSFTKYFNSSKKCDITVRVFPEPPGKNGSFFGITPFDLNEIVEYLEDLKKIFPFEFRIKETSCFSRYDSNNEYNLFYSGTNKCYDITYSIDGPHVAFMFILTLQRFLYAKGDCYFLALALKIKHEVEEFKKMNLFNILNCTISTLHSQDRGGDMFHIDPSRFSYLWTSSCLRDHLLKIERKAQDMSCYDTPGVADVNYSNVYCYDERLERRYVPYHGTVSFVGFHESDHDKKEMEEIIAAITKNLRILREYNGFSDLGKVRIKAISDVQNNLCSDQVNYYQGLSSHDKQMLEDPDTKFDESLLTDGPL